MQDFCLLPLINASSGFRRARSYCPEFQNVLPQISGFSGLVKHRLNNVVNQGTSVSQN
jgi:hypothetical protein